MKRETHERALRATAKVAAAAALFGSGCGGNTPPAANGADATPTAAVDDGQGQPVMQPVPAGTSSGIAAASAPDTSDLAVCNEMVRKMSAAAPKEVDDATKACCQTVAEDYDKRQQAWMGSERSFCCSALEYQGSLACTPWGPPTPPSMQWGIA